MSSVSSPKINIPGRSNESAIRYRPRAQSLIQPRAQSLQEPSVLLNRQIHRKTAHHEGVLEISLDQVSIGDSWSRRYCILKAGEFCYETMGSQVNVEMSSPQPLSSDGSNILESEERTLSNGRVPLEMAAAVRTVRRHPNAFTLVLVDGGGLTFRAPTESGYKEWLFHFHSSIIAVADRIRLKRSSVHEEVGFRSWRQNLGGSANFSTSNSSSPSSQSPQFSTSLRRMGTRDQSWQAGQSNMSTSLSACCDEANTPLTRSPLSRSRSSSVSVTSSSLGMHSHALSGGTKSVSPLGYSPSAPPSGNMEPPPLSTTSNPQEGGMLTRTTTVQGVGGLAASLKMNNLETNKVPTPPLLNGSLESGPHSPPLFGSPHGSSQDGSFDGNLRNSGDKQRSSGSTSGSRRVSVEGGLFDLSLEEADFSQVTANANALMSQLRPLTTPSPPPHSSDDVEPLLASPNNDQNSPSIEDTPEPLMSFPTPESPPLDPKKKKKCVRWSSAVFCARGVREKNEDTFYISDDAAEGIGYSSQAPHSDNQGRTVGSEAEDGTTSHATGGGSTPLNASKWDIRKAAKAGRTPIGYFGVYDGHCGKQSANMQALELHTDIFRELESWINMPDDDSQDIERQQAREAAISRAFLAHDSRYLADAREKGWYAGSTAVVGLVIEGGRKVMVANLGDSGAVIVRREIGPKLFSLPSPTNMKEGDHDEDDEDEEGKVEEGKAEEPIVSLTTTVTVEHVITTEQSTVVSYSSLEMREDVERREWNNALAAESSYEAVLLSEDHKPNRPDEKERIEAARGWVTEEKELFMGQLQMMDLDDPFIASRADKAVRWITISRVCQELAVSRAFGDPDFKGFGPSSHTEPPEMLFFPFPDDHPRTFCADLVLATPEVREHTLEEGDEFLILATDGLWDVLAPQEACQAIRRFKVKYQLEGKDPSGDLEALCLYFAEELTRLALRLGSADNITVTVVAFEYE